MQSRRATNATKPSPASLRARPGSSGQRYASFSSSGSPLRTDAARRGASPAPKAPSPLDALWGNQFVLRAMRGDAGSVRDALAKGVDVNVYHSV